MRKWQAVSGSAEAEGELISEKADETGINYLGDFWTNSVFLEVQVRHRTDSQLLKLCLVFSKLLIHIGYYSYYSVILKTLNHQYSISITQSGDTRSVNITMGSTWEDHSNYWSSWVSKERESMLTWRI